MADMKVTVTSIETELTKAIADADAKRQAMFAAQAAFDEANERLNNLNQMAQAGRKLSEIQPVVKLDPATGFVPVMGD